MKSQYTQRRSELIRRAAGHTVEAMESRLLLATTWDVDTAAELTAALSGSSLGDTIVLDATKTYVGQFTLPNKTSGSGWITIQSSNLASLPGPGVRVSPADSPNMPKLQSQGGNASVVRTSPGNPSHHFKFVGIEFVGPNGDPTKDFYKLTALMELGTDLPSQSTLASVPHDLVIDRCYFRPYTTQHEIRRAIALNSGATDILNSYIEEIHQPGSDSQAIGGWNGNGPYNIINNHLEGASENIMFGGATTRIPEIASNIVIRGNHIIKPLSWMGKGYATKNLFELKNGRNVLFEGNILENCWVDGQTGVPIVLKLGNLEDTYWNVDENVIIRNNIIRNTVGGVSLQGRDYAARKPGSTTDPLDPGGLVRGLVFTNNVFEDVSGKFLLLTQGPKNVTFDHNTVFSKSNLIDVDSSSGTYPNTAFKFTNNIVAHNQYGVFSSIGVGNNTFNTYFNDAGAAFSKNVLVDVNYTYRNYYTSRPNNYLIVSPNNDSDADGYTPDPQLWNNVGFVNMAAGDYHLGPASPYKNAGTDGLDLGANMDLVNASTAGAISGVWGNSFAYLSGSALMIQFDGSATPITLGTSGSNITVTKGGSTLSFAGVTTIFVTGSTGDDILQFNGPIAKPLTFSNENGAGDAVRVLAGTQTFTGDLRSPIGNVMLTVDSGATAVLGVTQHLANLVVNGNVTVPAGGNKVLVTKGLTLGINGKLDLTDNDMVVDYFNSGGQSPLGTWNGNTYDGVTGLIQSGRNGGNWSGKGIVSSTAGSTSFKTLGVAEASDVTTLTGDPFSTYFQSRIFSGEVVDSTAVLVKFTYGGDANMDGKLSISDYGRIDFSIGLGSRSWFNGDFNYDGLVSISDYGILDFNLGIQGAPL